MGPGPAEAAAAGAIVDDTSAPIAVATARVYAYRVTPRVVIRSVVLVALAKLRLHALSVFTTAVAVRPARGRVFSEHQLVTVLKSKLVFKPLDNFFLI